MSSDKIITISLTSIAPPTSPIVPVPPFPLSLLDLLLLPIEISLYVLQALSSQIPKS